MRKRGCQSPVTLTAEPLRSLGIRHTIPAGDVVGSAAKPCSRTEACRSPSARATPADAWFRIVGTPGACVGGVDGVVHRGAMADVGWVIRPTSSRTSRAR